MNIEDTVVGSGFEHGQWQIQWGFHGFCGTPLLKGCLRKYYVQTYYVHYTHTEAMHFSFNSSNNACVSTQNLMHTWPACMLPLLPEQKHVTTTTTRFSSGSSNFRNFTPRIHQKQSQKVRNPKFSWGACT